MPYVVAYDIADPARLRRVARTLERHALRCQKSVFLFQGDRTAVEALLDQVAPLIHLELDVIQAWKLGQLETGAVLSRGSPLNVTPSAVILADGQNLLLDSETDSSENGRL